MRLVSNENDKVHLYHICEYLEIGYEDVVEDEIGNTLLQNFLDAVKENIHLKDITTILEEFRNNKNTFKTYYDELKKVIIGSDAKDEDLIEDIKLFDQIYQQYTIDRNISERSLSDFLNYIALSPKKDLKKRGVALLTVHAAKGLEFDYDFLISMNQGIFPDYRAKEGSRALEEERRNCFVAITRAKKKLFISYTKFKDTRYGSRQHEPSQFLKEMGLVS